MKKISLSILKGVLFLVIFLLTFVLLSYAHLSMIRSSDLKKQNRRLNKIDKLYDKNNEYSYLDFSEDNLDNLNYNEVRFLASHNSYKKKGSLVGKLFVGLGDSFSEAKAMDYSYDTITKQLQNGIYSFELDLRLRKNNFEVTHVPIVDNSSTIVNFKKGLEEINTYINYSNNSFPVLIILEIKDDYMFLDPALKKIGNDEFLKLENDIKEVLGDKVYLPSEMLMGYDSLMERVLSEGWPKVSYLKGKVMFVIHAGKYANNYLDFKNVNEQVLFVSTYGDSLKDVAPFVIHNDLDVTKINNLVNQGYMVRTRIGGTISYTLEDVKMAMNSNAQILTSDFTVARSDIREYLYLKEEYTIIKR